MSLYGVVSPTYVPVCPNPSVKQGVESQSYVLSPEKQQTDNSVQTNVTLLLGWVLGFLFIKIIPEL